MLVREILGLIYPLYAVESRGDHGSLASSRCFQSGHIERPAHFHAASYELRMGTLCLEVAGRTGTASPLTKKTSIQELKTVKGQPYKRNHDDVLIPKAPVSSNTWLRSSGVRNRHTHQSAGEAPHVQRPGWTAFRDFRSGRLLLGRYTREPGRDRL